MKKQSLKEVSKKNISLKKAETKKIKGGTIITEDTMVGIGTEDLIIN